MPDQSELRSRVYFDRRNEAAIDAYGNPGAFVEQFSRLAKIKTRLGGETVLAGRLEGRQAVNITVRHDSETRQITPGWRARRDDGTVYNLRSIIDPSEETARHDAWIEILAEVGGNAA